MKEAPFSSIIKKRPGEKAGRFVGNREKTGAPGGLDARPAPGRGLVSRCERMNRIMKLGIVGLPNVGKSTLFNAITNAGAQSANYPFCTIEPNVGVVAVPDARLDRLAEMYHPKKYTPATIEFVDIAGLVKGASKGEGLGNKFLGNIRECDAIVHVVRCFDGTDIVHVEGLSLIHISLFSKEGREPTAPGLCGL